jgi:hypothetical protein
MYFTKNQKSKPKKSVESLNLLCIVLEIDPKYIYENIEKFKDALLDLIKNAETNVNWKIISHVARSFHYLKDFENITSQKVEGMRNLFLKGLLQLVFAHQGTIDPDYSDALEKIIHLCFLYRKNPESICEFVIKYMSQFLAIPLNENSKEDIQNEGVSEGALWMLKLIHLFETVSHITIKFLMFYDITINNLEKIKNKRIETTTNSINTTDLSLLRSKQKPRQSVNNKIFPEDTTNENDQELEKAFGGAEAEYDIKKQALQTIINKGLLGGNLLNEFFHRAIQIIQPYLDKETGWDTYHPATYVPGSNTDESDSKESEHNVETRDYPGIQFNNLELKLLQICVTCLCNFMILSPFICEEYLDTLFRLLEAESIPTSIKNNILVTMGDLIRRHSTILTEKKELIFRNLRTKDDNLRRTSVIVLCQLVLNDYLKLRGEVIDFVLLLNDSNMQIRHTLGTFFQELKKKDPKIFSNMIPDAINRFSTFQVSLKNEKEKAELQKDSEGEKKIVDEEKESDADPEELEKLLEKNKRAYDDLYEQERLHTLFTKFLKFILDFIDKDKIGPMLVEKLCNKLKFNKKRLEIMNIFKCFYFFVSNDNAVLKLLESSSIIKEKMDDPQVKEIMTSLINIKLKKSMKVNKTTLDDLEKIVNIRTHNDEEELQSQISRSSKAKKSKMKTKSKIKL